MSSQEINQNLLQKRGTGIAALNLVSRLGDRFNVQEPSLRGKKNIYEVWRGDDGKVRCSCAKFEQQVASDLAFRCEHIFAVKHALINKAVQQSTTTKTDSSVKTGAPVVSGKSSNIEANEMKSTSGGANGAGGTVQGREAGSAGGNEQQTTAAVIPLAFTNTLRTLRQPIDPKFIKSREGWRDRNGNTHMVEYVEWHLVADVLDRVAPTWSHSIRGITQIGNMVAITAAICIDGITREGVGTGTADNETGIKKAEHDALKRAAIKFGIARELYQRESEVIEQTGSSPKNEFPRDPLAKTMGDLVTPKQLGMIRALAREAGVDVEEECQQVLRCRTEELSKKAASSFIDHLKNLQGGTAEQPVRRAS